MKLKHIRAYGFKSFADKIDIDIKSNITAIVGPNGSGKSNIVDAVRWVLGEQSVKSLRGSNQMVDVIFKGSKSREAFKRAEVALVFDNSEKFLNTDLNEVEIKRVVYQTGENEYYLNNVRVRLKDILEVFLDSGIGGSSFNIISQGSIEEIVNGKPHERRIVFESAAGVLKYKKRKEESLRKLEKTQDNLEKINLVVEELEATVLPLKEQSVVAQKYLTIKEELEGLDIALMASDITEYNNSYREFQKEVEVLNEQKLQFGTNVSQDNSKLEGLKLESLKLDESLNDLNEQILIITKKLANIESEKRITLERSKYDKNEVVMNESLLKLQETALDLKKEINILESNKKQIDENVKLLTFDLRKYEEETSMLKIKVNSANNSYNDYQRQLYECDAKISILENTISQDAKMPPAVKNVLHNPRLSGIFGALGKLIEVTDDYAKALDVALGFNRNFVVVINEVAAKKAIEYLKDNNLGRATFLPQNVIKSKTIYNDDLNIAKQSKDFLGVLTDLIQYDKSFANVIENQLGNILVAKDIDSMNRLGKLLNYKYRIVTLDGEILHAGGSLTGGSMIKKDSFILDKVELSKLQSKKVDLERLLKKSQEDGSKLKKDYASSEEKENEINKKLYQAKEEQFGFEKQMKDKTNQLANVQSELGGVDDLLNNSLESHILELTKQQKETEEQKEILEQKNQQMKVKKSEISSLIAVLELEYRKNNSEFNKLENGLKNAEVNLGKLDIKLDHLLTSLSENYNMTYEKAVLEYSLDMDKELARMKVQSLKRELNHLGDVNLGSISEYKRLSERYDFLLTQKIDLDKACQELLEIILEMDGIMTGKFKTAFEQINLEFQSVFSKLFKGGTGELKLTDPSNLLETGIEIIAEPPGKKLNNISLLSGGEKTLTAIALLFAILNVKPVAFCILDEVEAALDEANVDMFGNYLQDQKDKSEFILITHKKRTMEYADTLYGITMQESGVSKIVSVKLKGV